MKKKQSLKKKVPEKKKSKKILLIVIGIIVILLVTILIIILLLNKQKKEIPVSKNEIVDYSDYGNAIKNSIEKGKLDKIIKEELEKNITILRGKLKVILEQQKVVLDELEELDSKN